MELSNLSEDYKKYRWFFTSSEKLVIGGKSAVQNDQLLKSLKIAGEEKVIMHTSEPGSPFSVILSQPSTITKKDLEECATFTGCFSRAWKTGKKKVSVDIFNLSQLVKTTGMKEGTWNVRGKIKRISVNISLVLTRQKGILRAVPITSVKNKKDILLHLYPGKIDKKDMLAKIQIGTKEHFSQEELLSALPTGGIRVEF